jgi:hypothetical protein
MTAATARIGVTAFAVCLGVAGAALLFAPSEVAATVGASGADVIFQLLGATLLGLAARVTARRDLRSGDRHGRPGAFHHRRNRFVQAGVARTLSAWRDRGDRDLCCRRAVLQRDVVWRRGRARGASAPLRRRRLVWLLARRALQGVFGAGVQPLYSPRRIAVGSTASSSVT